MADEKDGPLFFTNYILQFNPNETIYFVHRISADGFYSASPIQGVVLGCVILPFQAGKKILDLICIKRAVELMEE